jgi:hypothetical protein
MAYIDKYIIRFKGSPTDGEPLYDIRIQEKDFTGVARQLDAGSAAFTVKYQNEGENPTDYGIIASTATLSIFNDKSIPFKLFYSDDDERYKVVALCQTTNEKLYEGYLVQDDCKEPLDAAPYVYELGFSDNLGLIKNILFPTPQTATERLTLLQIIEKCINATGLQLPVISWANTFEQRHENKSTNIFADPLAQTYLDYFFTQENNGSRNCYDILNDILIGLKLQLKQVGGVWHILEPLADVSYRSGSSSSAAPCVYYTWTANNELQATFSYQATGAQAIINEPRLTQRFIDVNAQRRLERPIKSLKRTYKYTQQAGIYATNFEVDGFLISDFIFNGVSTKKYSIPPFWAQINYGSGVIGAEVIKNRSVLTNKPLEESLLIKRQQPTGSGLTLRYFGVRTNGIKVRKNDEFNFSCLAKTDAGVTFPSFQMNVILAPNSGGKFYRLVRFQNSGQPAGWRFNQLLTPPNLTYPITASGSPILNIDNPTNIPNCVFNNDGQGFTEEYTQIDFAAINDSAGGAFLKVPEDGQLFFEIYGFNGTGAGIGTNQQQNCYISQVKFEYTPFVNGRNDLDGHEHLTTSNKNAKSTHSYEVKIDDAPSSILRGSLTVADGTVTNLWRLPNDTTLAPLGKCLNAQEFRAKYKVRTVIDGTVDGLIYNGKHIDLTRTILVYDDTETTGVVRYFWIASIEKIDYRNGQITLTLWELYDESDRGAIDIPNSEYTFNYLYK